MDKNGTTMSGDKQRGRQERPDTEPEWKKSLRKAADAIMGRAEDGEGAQSMPTIAGAAGDLVKRRRDNQNAANYARGGVIPVMGLGSGTSDSIPVVVAGQEIGLSNGEGVATLPAKTMKTPGAIGAIESIIQATNDGKPPVPTKEGGRAQGGVDDPKKTDPNRYPYTGQPAPTAQQVYQGAGNGIGDMAASAFPQTAGAIRRAIPAARNALEDGNYVGAIGQVGRGAALAATGLAKDINNSAAYALGVPVNALKTFATGDSSPAVPAPGATLPTQPLPAQQTPVTSAAADRAVGVPLVSPPVQQEKAALPDSPAVQSFAAGSEEANRVRQLIADRGFVPSRGQGFITNSSGGAIALNPPPQAPAQASQPEGATLDSLVQERARRALAGDVGGAHALNGAIASMQAANTSGVLAAKGAGEIADANLARIAREGLVSAYDSGDKAAIDKATRTAIARGVLNPKDNRDDYHITTDPMGNQTRLNKSTGAAETLDRQTNTWKPIGVAGQTPEFASRAEAEAAQRAGKIKPGQNVMVNGRLMTVTP